MVSVEDRKREAVKLLTHYFSVAWPRGFSSDNEAEIVTLVDYMMDGFVSPFELDRRISEVMQEIPSADAVEQSMSDEIEKAFDSREFREAVESVVEAKWGDDELLDSKDVEKMIDDALDEFDATDEIVKVLDDQHGEVIATIGRGAVSEVIQEIRFNAKRAADAEAALAIHVAPKLPEGLTFGQRVRWFFTGKVAA